MELAKERKRELKKAYLASKTAKCEQHSREVLSRHHQETRGHHASAPCQSRARSVFPLEHHHNPVADELWQRAVSLRGCARLLFNGLIMGGSEVVRALVGMNPGDRIRLR